MTDHETSHSIIGTTRAIADTGIEVTPLGLGGAVLGGLFATVDDATADETIRTALEAGVHYLDTAPFYGYGLSEHRMGRQIRLFGRDKIVLSTKVGRLLQRRTAPKDPNDGWFEPLPFEPVFDYSYEGVLRSVEDSLHRLGTDHIDILLMHDIGALTHGDDAHPSMMAQAMSGGARAMWRLKEEGIVGAIGMGVNEWQVCAEALETNDWDVFLLAGRYTLLEQEVLDHFFPLCRQRGTNIFFGWLFNSGILAGGDTFNYEAIPAEIGDRVAAIRKVCNSHNVSMKAAALQFVLRNPLVVSVIPGVRSVPEFTENMDLLNQSIPDALWSDLKSAGLLHPDAPT